MSPDGEELCMLKEAVIWQEISSQICSCDCFKKLAQARRNSQLLIAGFIGLGSCAFPPQVRTATVLELLENENTKPSSPVTHVQYWRSRLQKAAANNN